VLFSPPPQERSAQVRTRARCLIDGAPTAAEFDLPHVATVSRMTGLLIDFRRSDDGADRTIAPTES
jgi:hypothetical protein